MLIPSLPSFGHNIKVLRDSAAIRLGLIQSRRAGAFRERKSLKTAFLVLRERTELPVPVSPLRCAPGYPFTLTI
jgi:hypothetical protein